MKILLTPGNWHPNAAGGEWYLSNLCRYLLEYGHEIKCICHCEEPFIHNGIECFPVGDMTRIFVEHNDLFEWCDIVFYQLIGASYGYNKCKQHNKPNIFFAHNFGKHYFLTNKSRVVYNSNFMASQQLFDAPSTVLQPLINYRDYTPGTGSKIALINCNENKGGNEFVKLAEMLPQYQFLGVKGMYGAQIAPNIPNVEYIENGVIPWHEIKILLVPSETESWSQVATEAICNGIPVICSDLEGLRENLLYAGEFINRNSLHSYVDRITQLMENKNWYCSRSLVSLQRARELDPLPRVEAFNNWLME